MSSKIYLLLMVFLCLSVNISPAQKKVDKALDNFLRSEFMLQFRDMRAQAEKTVLSFKAQQFNYNRQDVFRVSGGYNATVTKFNNILREITNDFADKRMESPYARENLTYKLKYEMRELQDFYATHFVQVIRDVKGNYEEDGSPLIAAFPLLAQAFSEIFGQMSDLRKQKRTLSRELVERKLYRSNRFRTWDEIRIEGGTRTDGQHPDYPHPNGGYPYTNQSQDYPSDYPDNGQGGYDQNGGYPGQSGGYPNTNEPQGYPSDYPNNSQDGYDQNEGYPDQSGGYPHTDQSQDYPSNYPDNGRRNYDQNVGYPDQNNSYQQQKYPDYNPDQHSVKKRQNPYPLQNRYKKNNQKKPQEKVGARTKAPERKRVIERKEATRKRTDSSVSQRLKKPMQ